MKRKAIEISNINDIKEIQSQMKNANMGVPDSDSLNSALEDAKYRSALINNCNKAREKRLNTEYGIKPMECLNEVCKYNKYDGYCFCNNKDSLYLDCNFRLFQRNPNHLDYDVDPIPTWKEALDLLAKNGFIKEDCREECKKASINYGKANNRNERDNTEVKGITFSQLRQAIEHSIDDFYSNESYDDKEEKASVEKHLYSDIIANNSAIEVEKIMGIFPNIKL